jgi:hypothetical protein
MGLAVAVGLAVCVGLAVAVAGAPAHGPAQRLRGHRDRRSVKADSWPGGGDGVRRQFVFRAAQHHRADLAGGTRGGGSHGCCGRLFVTRIDRVGEPRTGDLSDRDRGCELGDQRVLVRASGRRGRGPDGDGLSGGSGRLDRRHGPDDRDARLELRPERIQGVDRTRVAGKDKRIGVVRGGGVGTCEGPLRDVSRCA